MIWAARQLLGPLLYLRIHQGMSLFRSKRVYDWIIPIMLTSITVTMTFYYMPQMKIFTDRGIVGGFQKLLEVLVPFYIAALAAVATFDRKGLDEEMKGEPVYLEIRKAGNESRIITLTRRQFICYLFGYLAFLSLILFVLILFCNLTTDDLSVILYTKIGVYAFYLKIMLSWLFLLAIWQLIITTLLGVYFLSERLQVMQYPDR